MKYNLRTLIYTALMTAFVFITTTLIKIPIPFTNGYIHAGDMCIFVSGILLGPWYGGVAAGLGSAMADFLGGYGQWVLPTLIIKTIMGMLIGYFAKPSTNTKPYLVVTMLIWISSLFAFFYAITHSSMDTIVKQVEIDSLESALTIVATLKTQLLVVSILIPVLMLTLLYFKHHFKLSLNYMVGMVISGIWMVLGYYIASGIMYGNFLVPIFSIPWNIVQFGVGAVLAFLIVSALEKAHINSNALLK